MSRTIALLTDFGTTDSYVGVMKGVMLSIMPDLQFVDLTHSIQPQNVREAAFVLLNSYRYFPAGTIFLVVVDPGVGSQRNAIASLAGDWTFVAPDNGVLSYVLREIGHIATAGLGNLDELLQKVDYRRERSSNTFHGRDIFAPAAALLAMDVALDQLGHWVEQPVELPEPVLEIENERIAGEVLHIDHFGSAVTSIGLLHWEPPYQLRLQPRFGEGAEQSILPEEVVVSIHDQHIRSIRRTYADVSPTMSLALVGSSGYLELSVNHGSFAGQFGVNIGDPVEMQIG